MHSTDPERAEEVKEPPVVNIEDLVVDPTTVQIQGLV